MELQGNLMRMELKEWPICKMSCAIPHSERSLANLGLRFDPVNDRKHIFEPMLMSSQIQ